MLPSMQRLAQASWARLTNSLHLRQVYNFVIVLKKLQLLLNYLSFLFCLLQERGQLLYLRYAGRWGAYAMKNKLNLGHTVPGRHGEKYVCPCQFIEEHLKVKPPAGIAKYFTLTTQNIHIY